jgi:hypothetical protein
VLMFPSDKMAQLYSQRHQFPFLSPSITCMATLEVF